MDFKRILILLFFLVTHVACTDNGVDKEEEYLIGEKLKAISSLNSKTSGEANSVVIFDDTVRRIHHFDLQTMKHKSVHTVLNPRADHTVLFYEDGGYIIDLTTSHLTVIDSLGRKQDNPIQFVGTPISASFRPDLGYLVIYDDAQSVSFLKLSHLGQVLKAWVSGPILSPGVNIVSGDMNDNGELILALSNGSLGVVNVEKSLNSHAWIFSPIGIGLSDMKWLGSVPGQPQQILIRAQSSIVLFDFKAQSILDTENLSIGTKIYKYSKTVSPHIIFDEELSNPQATVAFVRNSRIVKQPIMHNGDEIMLSQLNLSTDNWKIVTTKVNTFFSFYDGLNYVREGRTLKEFKFSTLLAERQKALPQKAQLQMAPSYMFALFPSELGYAVRMNTATNETKTLKLFNLKYIEK